MRFYPAKLLAFFTVLFSISGSHLIFSEDQSSLEPISSEVADMPEGYAALLQDEQHPVYEPARRPYREIAIDTERAGFNQYYYQGAGFRLTDFFGVGASYQYYDEPKGINDMVTVAGLEQANYAGNIPVEILRRFAEPVTTRDVIVSGTIDDKHYPRFRYTYTHKEFDLLFVHEDKNSWDLHNFDLLETFDMFHRDLFLTLNPVYERRYLENKTSGNESVENAYIMQYIIHPLDPVELFGQLIWISSDQKGGSEKGNAFQYRLEPRILFKEIKLKVTPGWFHGDSEAEPGNVEGVKDEFYLILGKDIVRHWRATVRFDYVTTDNDLNAANLHIEAESFHTRAKISWEWFPGWDLSAGTEYGEDLSDFDQFSFYGFFVETEFVRYGLFRSTASVQWNNYCDIDSDEILLNVRVHAFRF
jgi:hypothetical protein